MVDDMELNRLAGLKAPVPGQAARRRALQAAMQSFDEKDRRVTQGTSGAVRLTRRARKLWSEIMQKKLLATPALAGLMALPIAGYAAYYLIEESPFGLRSDRPASAEPAEEKEIAAADHRRNLAVEPTRMPVAQPAPETDSAATAPLARRERTAEAQMPTAGQERQDMGALSADALHPGAPVPQLNEGLPPVATGMAELAKTEERSVIGVLPADIMPPADENRDRIEDFRTSPVRSVTQDPVSTFSIDVDTASYSWVRRSLKEGLLPQADTARVEEMINYFPYDWQGPSDATVPFNPTVSVMPTPWNENSKLMHVAIKGFDITPAAQPKANLVFLLDVSGSMDSPDKLPLLKSAFRLLVSKLNPDDTVSIVTYAGNAGTVLMPTSAAEREKILAAIDRLDPGGSTAGEAGIREAYRLAEQSFVKDGVNRVMLATDGDFNVGQTDDEDLKRLIEEKREGGVFLSVFGFGRGNLNDQMMQTIAQNGNGTAAYIDTLAEAEKVLVGDASSTLFPIAKDVKIQVEFNPRRVAEYRLIGYETRALAREDFNNDRVDAGEIGSGHSVTAIYEITPKGAPQMIDDLRYGEAKTDNPAGIANAEEYAFVKIRYKLPDEDVSKLITTPVTEANAVSTFDAADADRRFSVAVAAFGQKLRNADQTASFGYERILEIAAAARGADPFGYRSEFLGLVRLASALSGGKR